ncbi:ComEC/Rec2 family competence protein [Pseudoponticoccus marisrubri]|uniref:Competence protein n=1 Tax=Pseudoponticoccus marisrubri TaxID=1685382 RepID=A0A0W7WP89_9RHOB|nr:ComEC/Rec2 family competence protein [Pseudoponticoccus marisrubri]KUF12378.1 competence protein [Pseudoponticoccus marisrubri]
MGQAFQWLERVVIGQRGHLFPWVPVCLAGGIGLYFALRVEPAPAVLAACGLAGLAVFGQARAGAVFGPLLAALALVALGVALAGARAHQVAGPVLDFRYYGAIEGRVVRIDRSASDALRLTLDRVVLERMDPDDTPLRVRVSLHGTQGFYDPEPGATVILTGHLSPPGGAVEPGGFDFRRHAWFLQLGAVGYTRNPVLMLEPPGAGLPLFRARMWLSERVQARLPGETGAFAAAIMSGDRSGMGEDTLQALRDTNLAHLLAISGLHMGLLAGFVFAALRLALLLLPWTRHCWPVKKVAAFGALWAAAGYLALSGGNVATERAFIMAAAALCALMLDRRALSLRSVAVAALVVLMLRPEALLGPGFQMSFAATTALVAVFEQVSRAQRSWRPPPWLGAVLSVVVSSAVAGAATAPVGMAHFNQAAPYGLLANLVSVPVMGMLVVPMGVVAALLMPLGWDGAALAVMGLGLDWILAVAHHVAAWEGAVRHVKAPMPAVLPLLALGGLILCLWRGPGRLAGLAPAALGLTLWVVTERPAILVNDTGTLVGVMTPEGRALSRARGSGFVANTWLENDGQGGVQEGAAELWPDRPAKRTARAVLEGATLVHLQGKRATEAWTGCAKGQILVTSAPLRLSGGCEILDPDRLRRTGAVAYWPAEDGWRRVTDADRAGTRLWHRRPKAEERRVAQADQ